MKANIHPSYQVVTFTDISSGKKFEIGSTLNSNMSVEISSASHPFYTGEAKVIDTENRVKSFEKKQAKSSTLKSKVAAKKEKELKRKKNKVNKIESGDTLTLRDMLKGVQ